MALQEPVAALLTEELVRQIPGFFGILNLQSQFVLVNKMGAEWTGFNSAEAMQGLSYEDVNCKAAEHAKLFLQHDKIVKAKGRMKFLGYYCYSGDDWKVILGEKYLLKNEKNEAIGLVSHFDDFTHTSVIDVARFLFTGNKRFNEYRKKQFFYSIEEGYPDLNLTKRQEEILFFLLRGKTAKEIAKIFVLSPRTVEKHLDEIKAILNCLTKSELIEKAINAGFMNVIPTSILKKLK